MPPWKKTSKLGHTSWMQSFPVFSRTRLITVRNHDGTPLRLVTLAPMLASTSSGSFSVQFSMSATCLLGMRIRLASGFMFSMRLALRSPTLTPGFSCRLLAKLPPKMKALPEKMRLCGFRFR